MAWLRVVVGRGSYGLKFVLAGMLASLLLAVPAHAAFPGQNGKIAFTKHVMSGAEDIYVTNPDGTGTTNLTNSDLENDPHPAWSSDGRKLAFASNRNPPHNYDIYTMNADGGAVTKITDGLDQSNRNPAWAPDGTRLAFQSRSGIEVVNADGSGRNLLRGGGFHPAWSPDGSKIAFLIEQCGNPPSCDVPRFDLWTMNADGSGAVKVFEHADGPNWSPDGSMFAFQCNGHPSALFGICIANADGTARTRLTTSVSDFDPAWSPDGTKIAFSRGGGMSSITVMNADGTNQTPIVQDLPQHFSPDWQPLPGPQRSDYKNSAQFCKAERDFLGDSAFRQKYGGGVNAHGKCVSGK